MASRLGALALALAICLFAAACGGEDDTDGSSASAAETVTESPTGAPAETVTETATAEASESLTGEPADVLEKPLGSVTVEYVDAEGWETTVEMTVAESRPISLEELMVDYCPRSADSVLAEMGENMAIKIWLFDGTVTYHSAGGLSRPENTRINVTMNTNGDTSLTGLFACSTNDVNMDFFPPFGDPTVPDVAHPIRWVVGGAVEATPNNPEGDMTAIDGQWTDLDLAFTNNEICSATTTGALEKTEDVIAYPGCGVSPTRP